MEVAEIRTEIRRLGLTQEALAKWLGMHKGDVSKLLSGKLRMRLDTYRQIEAFLAEAERRLPACGVAETGAPFAHEKPRAPIPFITLEEAKALRDKPPVRMSEPERELFYRELAELGEAGRRLPRVTDMTDDEILGYDQE